MSLTNDQIKINYLCAVLKNAFGMPTSSQLEVLIFFCYIQPNMKVHLYIFPSRVSPLTISSAVQWSWFASSSSPFIFSVLPSALILAGNYHFAASLRFIDRVSRDVGFLICWMQHADNGLPLNLHILSCLLVLLWRSISSLHCWTW